MLAENALRMATVRIDELWSFANAASKPKDTEALHDMRIAAKRVRYLLELMEPCLGEPAAKGAKRAKKLQSLLGEIHDCDELLPMVREHNKRLRAEDAQALRLSAEGEPDLEPAAARAAPHRARYRGLGSLHAYLQARRGVLYARFLGEWAELERQGLREHLETALREAAERAVRAAEANEGPASGGRRRGATMARGRKDDGSSP